MNKKTYFYSVVRYVQDPIKDEPVNIGVILQSPQSNFITCKFLNNFRSKLSRTASSLDIDIVKKYAEDFKTKFKPFTGERADLFTKDAKCLKEDFLSALSKENSGKIQFADPRGGFCANLRDEINLIFSTFVDEIEENSDNKGVKRSRFKTQLQREFNQRKWLLKQRNSNRDNGIEMDVKIDGAKSGVNHTVDFALQNGKLWIIETLDMSKKNPKAVELDTYAAAFKIDDLKQGRKDVEGISVVSGVDGGRQQENCLNILRTYSKEVIKYSEDKEKEGFLKQIGKLIEHS